MLQDKVTREKVWKRIIKEDRITYIYNNCIINSHALKIYAIISEGKHKYFYYFVFIHLLRNYTSLVLSQQSGINVKYHFEDGYRN